MNALPRLVRSLQAHGLRRTLDKALGVVCDCCFDLRYGVDTRAWAELRHLTIRGDNRDRGARYQPTHVRPLRQMLRTLQPQFAEGSAFVDLGCGKGRALMVAAEFGFANVRGVEFAHELCSVAAANCAAYKRRRRVTTEFRIIESDVVRHRVACDEDVFFMYNPFDEAVMNKVLDNIAASLESRARRILIIYLNPRHAPVIEQRAAFADAGTFDFGPDRFRVYATQP